MESERTLFERSAMQFPARRARPTPKTAPPSEPPTQRGRSTSRKRERQRPESVWEVESTAVQRLLERCLRQIRLVGIGIIPNVSSISLNRVVNSAISDRFRTEGRGTTE